eukprot:CAMPEP_0172453340 /NCGR_PEP_ID=MMETSP1065-20121228/10708_1 /TAXON_ID=265537 /ORGANISM="Amphiprora paludosa, Strain CCMP125" /LENGTH=323 /DNA_ID=CAMNT_0013205519 /DNA_START=66 /DNA_END=1037 /DNA_ORIENTATION=+
MIQQHLGQPNGWGTSSVLASAEVYNAYRYDMTLPCFTPDGRLLQLEYARSAADHSAPILALPLVMPNEQDGTSDCDAPQEATLMAIITYRPSVRLQERLVVHESHHDMSSGGKSSALMIGMAGILADCGALGRKVQDDSSQHEVIYGTPFLTAQQWATSASRVCQSAALSGGLRPFGANLVVAETAASGSGSSSRTKIYITDPSGAIRTLAGHDITTPTVLLGGGIMRESKLKTDLISHWPDIVAQQETPAGRLACVFQIIQRAIRDAETPSAGSGSGKNGSEQLVTSSDLAFEVVLISAEKGIFKLKPSQLQDILSRQVTLS